MKKKIKVGIPRAFLYYRYYILWKNFFEMIGCNIVLSPNTDSDIVKVGNSLSVDESCLPSKIYLGHISYLSDKCDYILVPRKEYVLSLMVFMMLLIIYFLILRY